jgi:hypothetical protein
VDTKKPQVRVEKMDAKAMISFRELLWMVAKSEHQFGMVETLWPVGGLEHDFYDFPFSWECHHPN